MIIHDEHGGDVHVERQSGRRGLIEIRRVLGSGRPLRLILREDIAVQVIDAVADLLEPDE